MLSRALAVLVVGLVLVVSESAGAQTGRGAQAFPDEPFVPAQSARAFGDSVGVNVRLHLSNSSYGDFETVRARLLELGVRYVGDGLCPTCEHQIDRLRRLAAVGIRANLGVGNQNDSALMQQGLQVIRNRLLDSVVSITGPNEPDISGDPQWIAHTRAYQAELYTRVKADPALAHLPVIGPSIVHRQSRPALGDLSAYLDRGNIHPYPAGVLPMADLALERRLAAFVAGNKPLVATEVGYHNDLAFAGIHRGASERASAIYTPRLFLEGFRDGLDRTYLFQLADPWTPAQAQAWGIAGPGNAFGLLRWDLSRKPAFVALRNLMRTVDAGSAAVAAPGGLRYGVEGASPDVRQLLLRSADGSYALVLWRQVSVWDRDALRDIYPASNRLEVVLGERVAVAQRFDPVDSDGERERWVEPRRIPVDLAGAPVVLRLAPPVVPAPATPGGPAAPCKRGSRPRLSRTKKRQRLRSHLVIKVSCATVSAKGKLVVRRKGSKRRRRFKLKPVKRVLRNGRVTLRLKIPARGRRAAARALRHGGRAWATVTVTARSPAGIRPAKASARIALRLRAR
jgi:hypothetical protein